MIINGGIVTNFVNGGYATNGGNANNNTIIIYGGTFGYWVEGGWNSGSSYTANNNTVTIYGGTFTNTTIDGGYGSGEISNNTVNLFGGTFTGDIYGSYDTSASTVTNNVINLGSLTNTDSSSLNIASSSLYGYHNSSSTASGNTLNVYMSGVNATSIANFNTINFYIPSSATSGSTMLNLSGTANLSGTTINAGVVSGSPLTNGDTINLITASSITTNDSTTYGTLSEGVSNTYNINVAQNSDGTSLIATIGSSQNPNGTLNSQTQLIGQSAPGVSNAILGIGMNRVNDTWTSAEDTYSQIGEGNTEQIVVQNDKEVFMNMGGGSLKIKLDGGHMDTSSGGIDLGYARIIKNSHGILNIAPIIDYGHGTYDSYLDDGTHGEGDSSYWAGGFIARQSNKSGFYYEGSLRVGRAKMDFSSSDLEMNGQKVHTAYDVAATILSGHARIGYILRASRKDMFHVYGIYSHNHQNGSGMDLKIDGETGEHYDFTSVDSGKFRTGFRATRAVKPFSKIYTGLAYQYEYSGDMVAKYNGDSTPSTKMQGSSGLLEMGWQFKPTSTSPWMLDLNVAGWIGHQEGITASLKVKKEF
ncbi:MAG: hypothetical protein IJ575_00765 [Selenomonadaceae bacterium]|nr:hypothetical protein [Selenomonadaceae bacterium]